MLFSPGNKEEISGSARSEFSWIAEELSRRNRYKTCVKITVACKEICLGFLTPENCLKLSGQVLSQTLKSCDISKLNLPISAKFVLLFPICMISTALLLKGQALGCQWYMKQERGKQRYVKKAVARYGCTEWDSTLPEKLDTLWFLGWLTAFSIDSA